MKIAIVYDVIYPYVKGGAERRYYEVGKRFAAKGHEVHFYGMKFWEGNNVIKKNNMYYHGLCENKPLYTKIGRRSLSQAIFFGLNCFKLLRIDFDVIDCCGFPYFSLFPVKIICILKKKKLISTVHEVWGKSYWNDYLGKLGIIGTWIEKISLSLPDQIICVSNITANRLKNEFNYKKKIWIIANGIDTKEIKKVKAKSKKTDIIFAGRLMDFKNVDQLIYAVSLLRKKYNEIKCIIIGDGPEKEKLERLTSALGITKYITFLGPLNNHSEVYSYMKSSKVFVSPSIREGFGIALLEANACGIPVVTINNSGNAAKEFIINSKNGLVCELDTNKITKAINFFLKSDIDSKDCIDVANRYTWDAMISRLKNVYTL